MRLAAGETVTPLHDAPDAEEDQLCYFAVSTVYRTIYKRDTTNVRLFVTCPLKTTKQTSCFIYCSGWLFRQSEVP